MDSRLCYPETNMDRKLVGALDASTKIMDPIALDKEVEERQIHQENCEVPWFHSGCVHHHGLNLQTRDEKDCNLPLYFVQKVQELEMADQVVMAVGSHLAGLSVLLLVAASVWGAGALQHEQAVEIYGVPRGAGCMTKA